MATIAALTEDFMGAAPGIAVSTANSTFDSVSGAGSALYITDPFDGTRQMAEVTTAAQSRSMESLFTGTTKAWIRFDLDIETPPDVNNGIMALYDDNLSTNKILDIRVLAGTRTLQLRNVNTVVGGFGPVLSADTKYRVYAYTDLATGTTPAKVVRCMVYGGADFTTLIGDSGEISSTSLAATAGSARFGLISSSTAVMRIGRIRGDDSTQPFDTAGFGTPTGLTVTPVSATQLDVTWNAVTGATGYDLERSGGPGGTVIFSDIVGTSHSSTGLQPATTYTYRVRAVQ
jgi:hypothetical protein